MADESPVPELPEEPRASKLERAADIAQKVMRHKHLLVAAMEMLREKAALTEEEEVKIASAYEQGSTMARAALSDLVEKLQQAKLGKVVIQLSEQFEPADMTVAGIREKATPMLQAAKEQLVAEARPYLEKAKLRLAELRTLEEPTLQRLEGISENFRAGSKEIALGLKGAGREAADELVKRGKRWWMSAETEELEREFFDWVLKNIPKAERTLVHFLIGFGILLFGSGILLAAQEFEVFQGVAIFIGIALMLSLGLLMVNWGIKISETMKVSKGEIEHLARMTPSERRVFLAKRWTERAQREGVIDSEEARVVIEQTIRALPEDDAAAIQAAQRASEPAVSP